MAKDMTELEKEELFDWFKERVKMARGKEIDLTLPRDELLISFMDRALKYEFKTGEDIQNIIQKSFVKYKPDVLKEFVDLEDLKLKKPAELKLLSRFFNDYIENSGKNFKNMTEFYEELARCYAQKIEDIYGEMAYLDLSSFKGEFKSKICDALKENGYIAFKGDPNFLIGQNFEKTIEVKEENQNYLLETYEKITKKYIVNYADYIKNNKEKFEQFWDMISMFIENVEMRLSEQSKQNPNFIKNKQKVIECFEVALDKSIKNNVRFSEHFAEFERVRKAIEDKRRGIESAEADRRINMFFRMIKKVDDVLSIEDENGQNYPINYYTATNFEPSEFMDVLNTFKGIKNFWSKEQLQLITSVSTKVRKTFLGQTTIHYKKFANVRDVLDLRFKGSTITNKNGVLDLSNMAAYQSLVENVEDIIKTHKLPSSAMCITFIAKDLTRGRHPINLKETKNAEKVF